MRLRALLVLASLLLPSKTFALDSETSLATFDLAWKTIYETHFDTTLNGVDWEAVGDTLRPKAAAARDNVQLRQVLWDMVLRLHQSHFGIIPAEDSTRGKGDEAVARSLLTAVPRYRGLSGTGIEVRVQGNDVLVFRVTEGSPAHAEGVLPGWILTAIDGTQLDESFEVLQRTLAKELPTAVLHKEDVALRRLFVQTKLAGVEGSRVKATFLDDSDRKVVKTMLREPGPGKLTDFGGMPPMRIDVMARWELRDTLHVAVLSMDAWMPPAGGRIRAALDTMLHADGIVMDLRGNPGGVGQIAQSVAGLLFAEPVNLGSFKARDGEIPLRTHNPRQKEGETFVPFGGPVAILTDGASGSTSEVFAAGLLDTGRARVFGEPTAGAALPARITPLPNGDSLLHAVFDYIRPIGRSVEGRPIVPDEVVFLRRSDLIAGKDRVLDAALVWIASASTPKEVVLDE